MRLYRVCPPRHYVISVSSKRRFRSGLQLRYIGPERRESQLGYSKCRSFSSFLLVKLLAPVRVRARLRTACLSPGLFLGPLWSRVDTSPRRPPLLPSQGLSVSFAMCGWLQGLVAQLKSVVAGTVRNAIFSGPRSPRAEGRRRSHKAGVQ